MAKPMIFRSKFDVDDDVCFLYGSSIYLASIVSRTFHDSGCGDIEIGSKQDKHLKEKILDADIIRDYTVTYTVWVNNGGDDFELTLKEEDLFHTRKDLILDLAEKFNIKLK
jgi:hypothetical protein